MTNRREFLEGSLFAAAGAVSWLHARPTGRAAGMVQTVLGPLDPSKLGFTLPHEHLCASSAGFWQSWPEFFGGRANFIAKAVEKLKTAKAEGVDTIVDVTTADVGRDIRLIEDVSRKSGVNIIACTGHWLYPSLSMGLRTVEELTSFFTLEIERGIDGTGIKPGVIKVATDREGVTPFIERALRAAARTSRATGIPITTHTYAAERTAEKQAAIFEAEGVDPAMVCLGHCDDSDDLGYLTGLVKRGFTIGMDHLTWGTRQAPAGTPPILSWQQRAETVKRLVELGFAKKIFLSNDWYFGISMAGAGAMDALEKMNPDGMLFTSRKTIPYLKQIGVGAEDVRTMTVDNPRRFFGGG